MPAVGWSSRCLVAGVLTFVSVAGCAPDEASKVTRALRWETASAGDIVHQVVLFGTLHPRNRTPIFPLLGGRIHRIFVKRGDKVAKGTRLFALDNDKAHADIASRRLQLLRVRSATDVSERVDADAALQRLELREAEIAQAERALRDAETALSQHTMVSPRDGTVIQMNLREGQFVGPSAPGTQSFLSLADDAGSEIDAEVDEYDAAFLKPGLKASAVIEATGAKCEATIQDDPALLRLRGGGANSSVYNVRFLIDESFGPAQWGSTVRLRLRVQARPQVMRIPQASVVSWRGQEYAVVGGGREPYVKALNVGLCDTEWCEVHGLAQDTRVGLADAATLLQIVERQADRSNRLAASPPK